MSQRGDDPLTITGTSGSLRHSAPAVMLNVRKLFGILGEATGEEETADSEVD